MNPSFNANSDLLTRLVHELSKLPGIGEKSATRLAYHLLNADESRIQSLTETLLQAKEKIHLCKQCYTYTEHDLCDVCSHPSRNQEQICIVERPSDVRAIESTNKFHGTYHVLHGTLSPVEGISPEQLKIAELLQRVKKSAEADQKLEIILALNPSVEGEATGLYISRLLRHFEVKLSKIAYGLPMGGSIEYADRGTIGRALDNRVAF